MATTTINVEIDDHPAQEAFISDESPETAYIGGVGSGKTAGGVLRAGRHIAEWNAGETGVIVSPTVPMLRNVIVPELQKWGLLDRPGIEYRRSENRIEYPNGSTVILESANNDRKIERLRGLNLSWAWMDEAAYQPEKVYRILNDRLRTGQYRNLFATTTPRGFNWVYEAFGAIEQEPEAEIRPVADGRLIRTPSTASIVGVSTRANPANPEDYIEREERQHSGESHAQEIEGEFVQFEGLVYPWFSTGEHVVDELPETYDEVIYGIDWGHNNPAVILAIVRTSKPRRDRDHWIVAEEFHERRLTVEDIAKAGLDMRERWGSGRWYCDPAEPASIEHLKRAGLAAKQAENDVMPGIQHVSSLREELRVHAACQNLRNEFAQYQYKDGGDSDKPIKENDHCLDALRYALFSHREQGQDFMVTQHY
jgi:PBSX family phage terminase large subunit